MFAVFHQPNDGPETPTKPGPPPEYTLLGSGDPGAGRRLTLIISGQPLYEVDVGLLADLAPRC